MAVVAQRVSENVFLCKTRARGWLAGRIGIDRVIRIDLCNTLCVWMVVQCTRGIICIRIKTTRLPASSILRGVTQLMAGKLLIVGNLIAV